MGVGVLRPFSREASCEGMARPKYDLDNREPSEQVQLEAQIYFC